MHKNVTHGSRERRLYFFEEAQCDAANVRRLEKGAADHVGVTLPRNARTELEA